MEHAGCLPGCRLAAELCVTASNPANLRNRGLPGSRLAIFAATIARCEVLALWREAMKEKTGPKSEFHNNVMELKQSDTAVTRQGNTRSYTLSRLQRDAPELFAQVTKGARRRFSDDIRACGTRAVPHLRQWT